MFEHIEVIRNHYKYLTPYILDMPKPNDWVSPYTSEIDWLNIFSPIEEQTWMVLRSFGQTPLYPQYPVLNYFLDFGNPKLKVSIECDGKEWHTDKDKDNARDKILLEHGWHVFRISGADCYKVCEEYEDRYQMDEHERWQMFSEYYNSIEGLVKAISIFYCDYTHGYLEEEIDKSFECLHKYISPIQKQSVQDIFGNKFEKIKNKYYERNNTTGCSR